MNLTRSANPALNKDTFTFDRSFEQSESMTLNGTVNKTAILLFLVVLGASYTWSIFQTTTDPSSVMPWAWGGGIAGFILALITVFKKEWAGITAPLYAIAEGLFLGGISAIFDSIYPGIVLQAVFLTFGTLFSLLFAYRSGLIRVTENFKLGLMAATGGIFLIYMATWILGMFNINIPYIHSNGLIGIGFSLVVVVIAALNLVMDFDFIESGVEAKAPKHMEWYGAFGLVVTLIWLYIEFLRLLSKLNSRD